MFGIWNLSCTKCRWCIKVLLIISDVRDLDFFYLDPIALHYSPIWSCFLAWDWDQCGQGEAVFVLPVFCLEFILCRLWVWNVSLSFVFRVSQKQWWVGQRLSYFHLWYLWIFLWPYDAYTMETVQLILEQYIKTDGIVTLVLFS